jgi:hypothetical protein
MDFNTANNHCKDLIWNDGISIYCHTVYFFVKTAVQKNNLFIGILSTFQDKYQISLSSGRVPSTYDTVPYLQYRYLWKKPGTYQSINRARAHQHSTIASDQATSLNILLVAHKKMSIFHQY